VEKHWDKIDAEFALNEGGEADWVNGKIAFNGVQTTEKVPRGLELVAKGSSGHGSMPRMDNAVTHLAAAVAKVGNWQAPMRLNETTKAYFAKLATISSPDEAKMYTHLDDPAVQEKLRAENIFYNSMLRTSIVPTIIQGGFRENVIPADAKAVLDVRALPDENMDQLIASLNKMINDPQVTVVRRTEGQNRPAAPPSSLTSDMYKSLERAQQKVYPGALTIPMMATGATDGAQLRAKGVQTYGLAVPGDPEERKHIHGNDERVLVKGLGMFSDFLWGAMNDIAGAK